MPEQMATPEEVMSKFQMQTEVADIDGTKFKIRKLAVLDFIGTDFMDIPIVKAAMEGSTKEMTQEEKKSQILKYILENKDALEGAERTAILKGVIDPKFSDKPKDGFIHLDAIDPDLRSKLADAVMKFSGFGTSVSAFFR